MANLFSFYIAGIQFTIHGQGSSEFDRFLQPFYKRGVEPVDFFCNIKFRGVGAGLTELSQDRAWSFRVDDQGVARVMGANAEGEVMWCLSGSAPYSELSFEWHLTAFDAMYKPDQPHGRFGTIILVVVILRLLALRGVVVHGAAQVVDGKGILCTGPSGRGKSTISRLFDRCGYTVLSDERPVIRPLDGGEFRIYGTPWPSSGMFASQGGAPLRRIYFLEHGRENRFLPLTTREAVLRLLDVAMVPWLDPAFFDPVISTLEELLEQIPAAVFEFLPDESAVRAIEQDLGCSVV